MLLTGGPLGTLPQMEKARAAAGRAAVRRAACLAPAVLMVVDSMMAGCGGDKKMERRGWRRKREDLGEKVERGGRRIGGEASSSSWSPRYRYEYAGKCPCAKRPLWSDVRLEWCAWNLRKYFPTLGELE